MSKARQKLNKFQSESKKDRYLGKISFDEIL